MKQRGFGTMGERIKRRLNNDNDSRVIIQGANSQTGIGKTTLAIQLCRYLDQTEDEWIAEEKAFVDVKEYMNAHLDYPKGSCLLLDEIGAGADSRRAMSNDNVKLSQAWQTLRARNIAVVATLPSISMLDSRMLELSDWWVLVERRGIAKPHMVNVNDYAPNRNPQKKPLPGEERIKFPDLPDGDDDKAYLDEIKDDMVRDHGMRSIPVSEHKEKLKKKEKELEKEVRDKWIRTLYEQTDMSYADIAALDTVGINRATVGEVVRGV